MAVCGTRATTRTSTAAAHSVNFKRTSCPNQTRTDRSTYPRLGLGVSRFYASSYMCAGGHGLHSYTCVPCACQSVSPGRWLAALTATPGGETQSVLSAERWQALDRKRGTASALKTRTVLFSPYFSVALSLNHQQKIKVIIVMNPLTGLCKSGWIYERFYNNSTVVRSNPTVWLGAHGFWESCMRVYVSFLNVF